MGMNLAYKILSSKLKDGNLVPGEQIGIQIDQTLTQDSTGTMAYLQLEAMNIKHVAVEKAVAPIAGLIFCLQAVCLHCCRPQERRCRYDIY